MNYLVIVFVLLLSGSFSSPATQEGRALPETPYIESVRGPAPDNEPVTTDLKGLTGGPQAAVGPIAPAGAQPAGALSDRVVFTSAGHGLAWVNSVWTTGRGEAW